MKEWLKHKYGFLNIDDKFIYLTKSGNWSETNDLKEKNFRNFKTADFSSKLKTVSYLSIWGGLILFLFWSKFNSGNIDYFMFMGFLVLFYATYKYLIPEYGASFSIPHEKIKQINIEDNNVKIEFLDFNNKSTCNHFKGINGKGLAIIEKLSIHSELHPKNVN